MLRNKIIIVTQIITLFACSNAFALGETAPTAQIERSQQILDKDLALRDRIEQGDKVFIAKIIVKGVTLLTQDEVKEIIKPFQKRWLSKEDIQQIVDDFTQEYYQRGYFTQFKDITYQIKGKTLEIRIED